MGFKQFSQMIFLFSVTVILIIGYFYFFQISPTFVEQPVLERPADLQQREAVSQEHIIYLLNMAGAYKLHNIPFSGEAPLIEVYIHDTKDRYFFEVEDNKIIQAENTESPDIKLIISGEALLDLYRSASPIHEVQNLYSAGKFEIQTLKEEKVLALKGYKAIYDTFSENAGELTGSLIKALNPARTIKGLNLFMLLLSSIIIGIIIEKEF